MILGGMPGAAKGNALRRPFFLEDGFIDAPPVSPRHLDHGRSASRLSVAAFVGAACTTLPRAKSATMDCRGLPSCQESADVVLRLWSLLSGFFLTNWTLPPGGTGNGSLSPVLKRRSIHLSQPSLRGDAGLGPAAVCP